MSVVIMPSGVPADLGAGASLGDLSVGDAGFVALRFACFFAAGAGFGAGCGVLAASSSKRRHSGTWADALQERRYPSLYQLHT